MTRFDTGILLLVFSAVACRCEPKALDPVKEAKMTGNETDRVEQRMLIKSIRDKSFAASPGDADQLTALMLHEDSEVAYEAAEAVWVILNHAWLEREREPARSTALLDAYRSPANVERLFRALTHKYGLVRINACRAVAILRPSGARDALTPLMKDPDSYVREEAAHVIENL